MRPKAYLAGAAAVGLIWLASAGTSSTAVTTQTPAPSATADSADPAPRYVPVAERESPPAAPAPRQERTCNPNYSGCLKPDASDYDCAGGSGNGPYYTGPVQVLGYDEYGLDRDGDGWGCE